jgi:RNase adaptor protein for sRNA GlmZ degradation
MTTTKTPMTLLCFGFAGTGLRTTQTSLQAYGVRTQNWELQADLLQGKLTAPDVVLQLASVLSWLQTPPAGLSSENAPQFKKALCLRLPVLESAEQRHLLQAVLLLIAEMLPENTSYLWLEASPQVAIHNSMSLALSNQSTALLQTYQATLEACKPTLLKLCRYHIDTSVLSVQELQVKLRKVLQLPLCVPETGDQSQTMVVQLQSFGFKRGLPVDSDWVLDVRFLPNPFYKEALRPLTGQDEAVQAYLQTFPEMAAFQKNLLELLSVTLKGFQASGRRVFRLSIGCTGGKHRSVALVQALAHDLGQAGWPTLTLHREQSFW